MKIQRTDESWNPVIGCSQVSEGCRNCYAERMVGRIANMGELGEWTAKYADVVKSKDGRSLPQWNGSVKCLPERLDIPLRWRKPRRIVVNSMSDLFHPEVPFEFVDRVFAVMALCHQHTFQVLTKRPKRMADYLWHSKRYVECRDGLDLRWIENTRERVKIATRKRRGDNGYRFVWPLPNVWLGTSCEDQATADERIPHLLRCSAAVRFVSLEPLLGPIALPYWRCAACGATVGIAQGIGMGRCPCGYELADVDRISSWLHWVIVGGESGPHARPMNPDWVRAIRDQCVAASVPFFFRQWGEWLPGNHMGPPSHCYRSAADGQTMSSTRRIRRDNLGSHVDTYSGELIALRVGKRAAGRELDGRTWDEMPVTKDGER